MPMQDPGLPENHRKQVYYENLNNSSNTVTWYTMVAPPADLIDYVLDLLALRIGNMRRFSDSAAEPADESIGLSLVAAPQGAAVTVWPRTETGVQRVNRGLSVEQEEMHRELSRGTYRGNKAQAWPVHLQFGRPTDASDWAELYAVLEAGDVVDVAEWGVSDTTPPQRSDGAEEMQAGFNRDMLELVLEHDADVVDHGKLEPDVLWKATLSVKGEPEIPAIIEHNDLVTRILVSVETEQVVVAMQAAAKYPPSGVILLEGGGAFLCAGIFNEHSTAMAFSNLLRVIGLAYGEYRETS